MKCAKQHRNVYKTHRIQTKALNCPKNTKMPKAIVNIKEHVKMFNKTLKCANKHETVKQNIKCAKNIKMFK